jgi:drug/metabolite transporter (DMT)-like permease
MDGVAVVLALAAAALFAVAAVAQQQAASANVDEHGLRLILRLLRTPRWLAAAAGNVFGYGLQAAALSLGSLLVVQPLLVTTLVFALPLGARWNHRPIGRTEIGWAVALCCALAVFLLVARPAGGADVTPLRDWAPSLVVAGAVVVIAGIAGVRSTGRRRALSFAILAGTSVGVASAVTKSVVSHLGDDVLGTLGHWELYVLAVSALTGVIGQQLAFQAGALEVSFPATMVLDPVVSVVLGVTALNETVSASGIEWLVIAAAVLVLVAGTIALGRAAVPIIQPAHVSVPS